MLLFSYTGPLYSLPHTVFQTANMSFFVVIWDALEVLEWVVCFYTKNSTGQYFSEHDP